MLWFVLHGDLRKAFRRCSGHATAKAGEFTVDVFYPTVRDVSNNTFSFLRPAFPAQAWASPFPPSYVEAWIRNRPKLLSKLRSIDKVVSSYPGFRVLGDHVLLHFERVKI